MYQPCLPCFIEDINAADANRDQSTGFFAMVFHADPTWTRSGPASYIKSTLSSPKKYPLTVALNSLVTKSSSPRTRRSPRQSVSRFAKASPSTAAIRATSRSKGVVTQFFANKEVIISGGTFNTPQILKLSGIGPAAELKKFNIPVVRGSPGRRREYGRQLRGQLPLSREPKSDRRQPGGVQRAPAAHADGSHGEAQHLRLVRVIQLRGLLAGNANRLRPIGVRVRYGSHGATQSRPAPSGSGRLIPGHAGHQLPILRV